MPLQKASGLCHQCTHQHDCPDSDSALVDSSCALLSFLDGMYFNPYLAQSAVCVLHHTIIPSSDLPQHLQKHLAHVTALRHTGLSTDAIQNHLSHLFSIPIDQST
jgi:hypothetical protein